MALSIPSVGGAVTPVRFAITALGAGAGFYAYYNHVREMLPNSLTNIEFVSNFGLDEVMAGAMAILGAVAANTVYNMATK